MARDNIVYEANDHIIKKFSETNYVIDKVLGDVSFPILGSHTSFDKAYSALETHLKKERSK